MNLSSFIRYRAVFFDLVGTLIGGRQGIGRQYADVLRRVGLQADEGKLDAGFRAAMKSAPPMSFPGKGFAETAQLERRWWKDLVRRVMELAEVPRVTEDAQLFDGYFTVLFEHFTTSDAWVLYDDVMPTLATLKAAGIELGLVTNYDTRVYPVLDALGLSPLLDSVTIPADVGAAKPDKAIFDHAVRRHGLHASEVLFVGDDWEDDYLGAGQAGLLPVLLDRTGKHVGKQGVRKIGSLEELL